MSRPARILLFFAVVGAAVPRSARAAGDELEKYEALTSSRVISSSGDGFAAACVSVWSPSGSTNGTVTVFAVPFATAPGVQVAQYATPSSMKTFCGAVNGGLRVVVSGLTSGDISVALVKKRPS